MRLKRTAILSPEGGEFLYQLKSKNPQGFRRDHSGTEVSDAAPACTKCGRPIAEEKPDPDKAPKKRKTRPVTWLVLVGLIAVGGYKFTFSKQTKRAINRVASSTGVTITPWIDRSEAGVEVLLKKPDQRDILGKSIVNCLHPSGEYDKLASYKVAKDGSILQLQLTADWKGGVLGTAYSTTVVWSCNKKGHIKTIVTKDNGPFGFEQKNLDALDKWFRTDIWPIVDSNAGG